MVSEAPHRVLEFVLRESAFIEHLMKYELIEGGRVVRRLYDEVESLVRSHEASSLRDIARMFATRVEHGLPLNAPYIHTRTDAVQVMTAHKSKGLEFEHVFIPHLSASRWGDTSKPTYFKIPITKHLKTEESSIADDEQKLDDERKLLYVAMTRAKSGLHLSSSKENVEGRPLSPTRLLDDVGGGLITEQSTETTEEAFNPLTSLTHTEPEFSIDAEFLMTALKERGLSATSLNNYLKSPWNYLYRNVLRIPELQEESAQFGTALHSALCLITRYRTTT